MTRQSEAKSDQNGTVAKSVDVLQRILSAPSHSASAAEIAEALDIPRPTANRIISNLIRIGLVKREAGRARLIEGDRLVTLALAALTGASQRGPRHEILNELALQTRETCNVGIIAGGHVTYIDRVEAAWPLTLRLNVGSQVPLHCSAIGKVLLSAMPDRQREKYLETLVLKRQTDNTICEIDPLRHELDRIAHDGVAHDREECFAGVVGIAVPIATRGRVPIMGLGIAAPSARLTIDDLDDHIDAMRAAAGRLSRCYGN